MAVIFYYDIVCPFAYMASHIVEAAVSRAGGKVHWRPVLLGGLYKVVDAPQGKDGSAMDVMAAAKVIIVNEDFERQAYRYGVPFNTPHHHPQKTLHAMRILAGIDDQETRITLSKAFYKAYWQEGRDMEEHDEIQAVVDTVIKDLDVVKMATNSGCSQLLKNNTEEAGNRGAFGVPGFYVNNQLFWGVDRLFLVERMLGRKDALPERLATPPPQGGQADLTFYFDYSSPWSFIGNELLESTIQSVSPVSVRVHYVPILLGALFKNIGTPQIPGAVFAEAKRQYLSWELSHFANEVAKRPIQWPESFPIRTVLPLRVTLASGCDPKLIKILYRAAWEENKNIGDPEVLKNVLTFHGFPSTELIEKANTQSIKDQLTANTKKAEDEGACGVPTFQVNGSRPIWGQDRLHVVADMLCGWKETLPPSKL